MTLPESSGGRRFVWPAEYYSRPAPEPVVPRWVTYGCGGASVLALVAIFTLGAVLSASGFSEIMDLAIGMSLGEMRGQFTTEVTAEQKKSLEAEIEEMRQNVREERASVASLQPFLEELRKASSDSKITPEETVVLTGSAEKINRSAKR